MSQKKLKELRRKEKNKIKALDKKNSLLSIRKILKDNWKFLVLLLLGIVFLYLNAMRGDFVSDDYATIPNNPLIMNFKYALSGSLGGILNLILATVFGINSPISYHILSLLIYLIILVIVFVLIEVLFGNKLISRFSTLIFAVLPVHVEAVSWISGKPYLINALFVLMSLVVFILYSRTEKRKYLISLIFLTILTFLVEKTRSTSLLLLVLLYWVSFENKLKEKINFKKILMIISFLFFIVILILWPQLMTRIESVNSGINASESIFYSPFFQYSTAIPKYLQLIWAPLDLTLYHTMYIIPAWLNWLVLTTYLFSLAYFFSKDKRIFFALAFIFMATAPSMAPVKISWLVAERYVFLGSLGFALLLGIIFEKFWKKQKTLTLIILISLLSFYGVLVFLRNIDWKTNHNLWIKTCQVSPNSHNAWNNIGDDYDKLGQYDNAIKGFRQSTLVKKNYADAYHNMANIFVKTKRFDLARSTYRIALSYNPNMYQTYLSLIQINLNEKKYDLAFKDLESLKKIKPNDVQVAYIEALISSEIGRVNEAKIILKRITNQFPNYKPAVDLLLRLNGQNIIK